MSTNISKILIMVEIEGVAYGVELPQNELAKVLEFASTVGKRKKLGLAPIPNQNIFDVVFDKVAKSCQQ